jgi:hypothetical protein
MTTSSNNGSPTVWVDEDDGSIVIQGWKITDESTLAEITAAKPSRSRTMRQFYGCQSA